MSDNTAQGTATDNDPTMLLANGINAVKERKEFYEQSVREREQAEENGRQKLKALQEEIDAENAQYAEAEAEAGSDYADEIEKLVQTGWATKKALESQGIVAPRRVKRG